MPDARNLNTKHGALCTKSANGGGRGIEEDLRATKKEIENSSIARSNLSKRRKGGYGEHTDSTSAARNPRGLKNIGCRYGGE